jgi:hypothetical protein
LYLLKQNGINAYATSFIEDPIELVLGSVDVVGDDLDWAFTWEAKVRIKFKLAMASKFRWLAALAQARGGWRGTHLSRWSLELPAPSVRLWL